MKKLLLLMFMALMSAMTLWAGQLIIDCPDNITASPSLPNPGQTVTLTVDFSTDMLAMRLSELLIYEEVGGYLVDPPLAVTALPGTPDPLIYPSIGYYTFTMPTNGNDVHVQSGIYGLSQFDCLPSNNGTCQVSLIEGQPLPAGTDPQHLQVADNFKVKLTATPDPGYVLASYYVIAGGGQSMIVDANGVFDKPAGPVQVIANFKMSGTHFVNIDPTLMDIDPSAIDLNVVADPEYASDWNLVRLDIFPNNPNVWVRNIYLNSYPDYFNIWQDVFIEDGQLWFEMPDPDEDVLVNVITDYSPNASDSHQIFVATGINDGSVAIAPPHDNPSQATRGEFVKLELYPDPGFKIDQVFVDDFFPDKGDRVEVRPNGNQEYSFPMPGHDVTVSATFVPITDYTVNVDQGTVDGTIYAMAGSEGGPYVPSFKAPIGYYPVELYNTPDPGYELDQYIVTNLYDGTNVPVDASDQFTMPVGDVFVTATFKLKDYNISINSDPNGTIDVNDIAGVNVPPGTPQPYIAHFGDQITLDFNPNPGYEIDHVDIVAADPAYNMTLANGQQDFVMPPCDITLVPTFKLANYTVNVDLGTVNGTIYARVGGAGGPGVASFTTRMGRPVRLYDNPNPGYELDQYIVTNLSDGSDVPLQDGGGYFFFDMPASDVFVTATFKPKSYNITINISPNNGGNVTVLSPANANYTTGSLIQLDIQPKPGFNFGSVSVIDGNSTNVPISTDFKFIMPPSNVTVTVTFTAIPYTLYVENNNSTGIITDVIINNTSVVPLPVWTSNTNYNYYSPVYVTDAIQVTSMANNLGDVLKEYVLDYHDANIGGDNLQTIMIPNPPGPYSITATLTIPTCPGDMWLRANYEPYMFEVKMQPVNHGTAQAWLGTVRIDGTGPCITYQAPIDLKDYPDPGYELDYYEVYDFNYTYQFSLFPPIPTIPMPLYDIIVVPHFKKKIFYVHCDCALGNGDMYAWNLDTNVGGVTGGIVINVFPATIGQRIRLAAEPYPIAASLIFNYFYLDQLNHPIYGQVRRGEMQYRLQRPGTWYTPYNNNPPNDHSQNWYIEEFTMPPFDLFARAKIADGWLDYEPFPITNDLLLWCRDNITGAIMLHNMPPTKMSMRSDTGWDEPENYGWASVVPGQPMYFTVAPNLGYQVKKSDITIRLYDISQGDGGQLFRVLRGSDGDIDGPDEEITGPTDFSFIFEAPDGVDPSYVRLGIDADFGDIDYTITIADGLEHGTVEGPATAKMDETVTLTVTPDPGYRLASLTVTPETPGFFTTETQNGQFVMPASNVIVTATFEESDDQLGDVNGDGLVNIADVTTLINYLLSGGEAPANADCNNDTLVNIADVTTLINYLLKSTW